VPYITPPDIPEGDTCRPLSIPTSPEWLAFFGGALTELTKSYNWEQETGISVADTIEKMEQIVNGWYDNACGDCLLPGDSPIFRIGEGGHIEQLVNGEWVEPTGDYTIPPTAARTEPTEEERICLAAANAVNALQLLYESLSDSFGSALDAVDAAAALVATVVGGIGLVIGAITGGMIKLAGFIFASVYAAVEWITADLWDAEFTEKLTCIFKNCATDVSDVVHFDFDCIYDQLRTQTALLDPTVGELRLFGQLSVIMGFIGVEGLEAAGTATAVETYDCDGCFCEITLEATAGGGIVEFMGGRHWRVTSTHGAHDSFGIIDIIERCWGYCNFVVNYGAGDYANFTNCTSHAVIEGFPCDCNGFGGTGDNSGDIIALYIQGDAGEFQVEFDVYCQPCEGDCEE